MILKEIILLKNKKIYVIEDEGVFCTEYEAYTSVQLHFDADDVVVQKH